MMAAAQNDNALREQGEVDKAKATKGNHTKINRVIQYLKKPGGLNRFEAEYIGDHCLNSTVAKVREIYGDKLTQRWETVPTRYSPKGVRVLRYWLVEA